MRNNFGKVLSVGLLLVFSMACGGEEASKKEALSTTEKITPLKTDNYKTLMTKELENFNYISYGYFNFDSNQVKVAADNFATIGNLLATNIPAAYKDKAAEWKELCTKQVDIAETLKQSYASRDFEAARGQYRDLMNVCMECHSLYRKHLLK